MTDEFDLPMIFRFGMSFSKKLKNGFGTILAIDAIHPSDNTESINIGTEFDAQLKYTIYKGLYAKVAYAYLKSGDYFWNTFSYLPPSSRYFFTASVYCVPSAAN